MLARWLIATAIAVIIPVGGWIAVTVAENKLESDWITAVEAEYGTIPAEERESVTLRLLCAEPEAAAELADGCNDTRIIGALRALIVVSLVLSGVLLAVSLGIVLVSHGNRARMAALFRPGLTFLLIGLGVLIVAEGVIVIGALWELMLVIGRVYPFVILAVGIGVLAGVAGVLQALWAMLRPSTLDAQGVELRRDRYPALFAEVDDIAAKLGTEPPTTILAGLEPNFYVVETDVQALRGRFRGKVMYLSVLVSRVLSRAELRAIIGHELGHFRGLDTAYSKAFAPVYAGGVTSLQALSQAMSGWRGIAMLPAFKMLEAFFVSFAESESTIGRTRELEADAAGVEASSAAALGSSLLKLERTAGSWDLVFDDAVRAARSTTPTPNLADAFVARARAVLPLGPVVDGPERRITHPFDTHPPVADRLAAMGLEAGALEAAVRDLEPVDPAAALFGDNRAAVETELSEWMGLKLGQQVQLLRSREAAAAALAGPSAGLRAAATTDADLAALLPLFAESRDIDLTRPVRLDEPWVAVADLRLSPAAMPEAMRFRSDPTDLVGLEVLAVVGLAAAGGVAVDGGRILPRGTRLEPVGLNADELRTQAMEVDLYRWPGTDGAADRLVVVQGVGMAELDRQVAGLLVVPASDRLADVLHDDRLTGVLDRLVERVAQRPTFAQ
jgi:Zn-dependent protease with chaperone function